MTQPPSKDEFDKIVEEICQKLPDNLTGQQIIQLTAEVLLRYISSTSELVQVFSILSSGLDNAVSGKTPVTECMCPRCTERRKKEAH